MKNKFNFEFTNLVVDKAVAIDSLKISIEVEMEPEVALKNFALLTELGNGINQIVAVIKECQQQA